MCRFKPGFKPFATRAALTVIAAAMLAACGARSGDAPAGVDEDDLPPNVYRITPSGGTIRLENDTVRLIFEPGAVDREVRVEFKAHDPLFERLVEGADVAISVQPPIELLKPAQVEVLRPPPRSPAYGLATGLGALLFVRGGNAEALADQAIRVDGRTNTAWATGWLTRLEPFAFSSQLKTDAGADLGSITMNWRHAPEKLTVGVDYRAEFGAQSRGFAPDARASFEVAYKDTSGDPLRHAPDATLAQDADGFYKLPTTELRLDASVSFGGYGRYAAERAADNFGSSVQFKVSAQDLRVRLGGGAVFMPRLKYLFSQPHTAESAPAPQPPQPPQPPSASPKYVVTDVRRAAEGLFGFHIANDLEAFFLTALGLEKVGAYAAHATSNPGLHIVDLTTGETVISKDLTGMPMYGVVPHIKDGAACLFGYGTRAARTCYDPAFKDFGFTEIGINTLNVTDAGMLSPTPIDTPTGARQLLWYVADGSVVQEIASTASGSGVGLRPLGDRPGANWYRNGGTPTGKAQSAYFNAAGDRVLIARGEPNAPGQLWFGNPADPNGGMFAGSLGANGNDTRKIRCAAPVCAVSSFGGLVTIVLWDGANLPTIVGTIPGTTGSVGIDVADEGANRAIRSADFNNDTVTKTIVDSAGQILSSITLALPPGCTKPGHVTWQPGADNRPQTLVSCSGVNAQDRSAIATLFDDLFFAL